MSEPMDHRVLIASLPPETRAAMTTAQDGPGLRHLAGHVGVIMALAGYVGFGLPLWPLALWPLGIALAFLFTLQHECTHRTPFATPWINEAAGHICGLILLQPFHWFRAFHMAHHKHTNDPDRDPELSSPRPESRADLLWHLATPGYWTDKVRVIWANATGPAPAPYISSRQAPVIRREGWLFLLTYLWATIAMVTVAPLLFWVWLLPLTLGFPVLRLYLLAEHGRCPAVADMFENSRTTLTNRIVRFLAWNMPFHAEHHAWPSVPFHRLPALHDHSAAHLKSVSNGYSGFVRETFEASKAR